MRDPTRLSPGTQIVLKAGVQITAEPGSPPRKPGFIGEIIQSLEEPEEKYQVLFTDGVTLTLPRRALVVRRTLMTAELDMLAPDDVNWLDFAILRVRVGPRAYGFDESDGEDDAIRSIYLPPAQYQWSLYKTPEQIEIQRQSGIGEEICWEIEKFVRQGLAAYPGVLETLWSPAIMHAAELGQELRAIREAFLSKLIYGTFTGYAMSQFRKMGRARDRGEEPRARHSMQLIRLMLSGITAARRGELDVAAQDHHTELLAIRSGRLAFDETYAWAVALQRQFEAAMHTSPLPDLPDYETVNTYLIRARQSISNRAGR